MFFCDPHLRIKVVQLTLQRTVWCYPFMQPTSFTDNMVYFLLEIKATVQSLFHDDVHIQQFGKSGHDDTPTLKSPKPSLNQETQVELHCLKKNKLHL